jgi:hypothetical protein
MKVDDPAFVREHAVTRVPACLARSPMDRNRRLESGRAGWILLWLLGVPIPVLLVLYVLRGCT